jgi:hypothetical protein
MRYYSLSCVRVILQFVNFVIHIIVRHLFERHAIEFRSTIAFAWRCSIAIRWLERIIFLYWPESNANSHCRYAFFFFPEFVCFCLVVCLFFSFSHLSRLEKFLYLSQVTGKSSYSSAIYTLELYYLCVINAWRKNALFYLPNAE